MTEPDKPAVSSSQQRRAAAAKRALAEAAVRRQEIDARTAARPLEQGGRGGLDPARYGDWEIKGLTSDF